MKIRFLKETPGHKVGVEVDEIYLPQIMPGECFDLRCLIEGDWVEEVKGPTLRSQIQEIIKEESVDFLHSQTKRIKILTHRIMHKVEAHYKEKENEKG